MATKTINTILNLKDKFSSKMKQVSNKTKQNGKQMKLLNNHVNSFKQTAVSGFTSVAKKAAGVGIALAGIGVAASSLKNGIGFVKDYHASMSNMQAATGATAEEMAEMKSQITEMYKQNMGESWSDLASAMTTAKQITGQMGEELKQTTSFAVTYRDVFGEDIQASVKTADTMMKNFGITSNEAYNLLASGAQKGLNKSGELLDTANEYSVYFNSLGFSANEMFDIFSTGLESGAFNLDKVGDAMKEFGIRSKDGSKSSAEGFKALGLNAEKMTSSFAAGGPTAQKAFSEVMAALEKIKDPVKKNAAAVNLFGTQAEDMEKDVIAALGSARRQFDMTKNTMDKINQVKYDNPTQAMKGIGRLVETSILVPIANRVLPKLSEFGQWFKDHTPQIEAAIDTAFTRGAQVLDVFKQSIGWVKDNANWLIPVIGGLTAAIVAQKIIGTISTLYKAWTAATTGITIAQALLNVVMSANPFGLIAIAIGALIGVGIYLWKNWDVVKEKAAQLWEWLKGIWEKIKTATVGTFHNIVDSIRGSFSGIVDAVKAPINGVIDMINGLIDKVNGISFDVPAWMGGGTFGVNIPKIPNFAMGTSYFPGGLAQINERGGEIVNLPGGSQIIPADKSEKIISGSRSGGVSINIYVQGDLIGEEEQVNRIMNKAVPQILTAMGNR